MEDDVKRQAPKGSDEDEKFVSVCISLPKSVLDELDALRAKDRRKRSNAVCMIVEAHLAELKARAAS